MKKFVLFIVVGMAGISLALTACFSANVVHNDSVVRREFAVYDSSMDMVEVRAPQTIAFGGTHVAQRATFSYGESETFSEMLGESARDYIIRRAFASIETIDFDDSVRRVNELTARSGGFVQQSNVSGQNDRRGGEIQHRHANFTIRIPATNYNTIIAELDTLGAVIHLSTSAEDVSEQHSDLTSRLTSLRTQEARILQLLAQSGSLTELLELESRLGSIIFQIERYTANLSNLENRITYSTIDLHLMEVEEFGVSSRTALPTTAETFLDSIGAMGTFFMVIVLALTAALPWLILLAIIGLPIWLIIRRRKKKKSE